MTRSPETLLPILVRSPVHVDVFAFCLRNPGLHVSVEHLARSLGRNLADVEDALEDLGREGWISRKNSPAGDTVEFHAPPADNGATNQNRLDAYLALVRSASRSGK